MTPNELKVIDTVGTPEYLKGDLSDEGRYNIHALSADAESSQYIRDGYPLAHDTTKP